MALRSSFAFPQAQCVPVSLIKPAPFCKLSADFGSTTKCATVLPFSSSQTLALFSLHFPLRRPFSSLTLSSIPRKNYPLPPFILFGYNEHPATHFFLIITLPMSSPDEARCCSYLQPDVVSFLLALISLILLLSRKRTISSKFFDTKIASVSLTCTFLSACCVFSGLRYNKRKFLTNSLT